MMKLRTTRTTRTTRTRAKIDKSLYPELKRLSLQAYASVWATGWLTVWEGAVRSGKTVASLIAWYEYIKHSKGRVFFMTGKTYGSLYRNVIDGEFGLLAIGSPYIEITKDRSGSTILRLFNKKIYLFGASDNAAYMRIKGLTATGWYADEVATHPENFIVEAFARTAVSKDRRIFWTLNPTIPSHYIYTSFMDKYEKKRGYMRFKFTLEDNLAMTAKRRKELMQQYTGRYRLMYIMGERCAAEGSIYDNFSNDCVYSGAIPDSISCSEHFLAIDYGTINPCVFLDCCYTEEGDVYVTREYRWDSRKTMSQKTDEQYISDLAGFIGTPEECSTTIIVDPSSASLILALSLRGYYVLQGDNSVIKGIRKIYSLIGKHKLHIHESCVGLISEMESYHWDDKAAIIGIEKPVKVADHAPDALRYFVLTAVPNSF